MGQVSSKSECGFQRYPWLQTTTNDKQTTTTTDYTNAAITQSPTFPSGTKNARQFLSPVPRVRIFNTSLLRRDCPRKYWLRPRHCRNSFVRNHCLPSLLPPRYRHRLPLPHRRRIYLQLKKTFFFFENFFFFEKYKNFQKKKINFLKKKFGKKIQ